MKTSISNGAQNGEALVGTAKWCQKWTEDWCSTAICPSPLKEKQSRCVSLLIPRWLLLDLLWVSYTYLNCTKAPSNAPFTTAESMLTFNLQIRTFPSLHSAILVMQQPSYSAIWLASRNLCWGQLPSPRKSTKFTRPPFGHYKMVAGSRLGTRLLRIW